MDGDRVLHASRVATREDDDERRPGIAHGADDGAIAAAQPVLGQPQAAELIVFVRIRAGEVEHAVRSMRHHLRERARELAEKRRVARAVWQSDVERPARLPHRVIVLLVHREREYAGISGVLSWIRASTTVRACQRWGW